MRFDSNGNYLGAFGFGWDITPAIYSQDGSWAIVLKNNHYGIGSYCDDDTLCPPDRASINPAVRWPRFRSSPWLRVVRQRSSSGWERNGVRQQRRRQPVRDRSGRSPAAENLPTARHRRSLHSGFAWRGRKNLYPKRRTPVCCWTMMRWDSKARFSSRRRKRFLPAFFRS